MNTPKDIAEVTEAYFQHDFEKAIDLINMLTMDNTHCPSEKELNRIKRCVLVAADEDIDKLIKFCELAQTDYRDLIMAAEYEPDSNGNPTRVIDLSVPFKRRRKP